MHKRIVAGLLATTILVGSISPSFAYYSKTDYTESFEIQSNQSAFLIPLQGANKETQAQFGSKDYLQANKVPAKRVQIPHGKIPNSGSFGDYYVPTAKLIVVDRTPFNREWTDSTNTGTSAKKEGFHFESKDSLNIETDITIAASVSEENAATFLYYFGTVAQKNTVVYDPAAQYQTDAYYAQTYASISYGRSLADVMDTVGRGKVQQELATAFAAYDLADAIQKKAEIMKTVSDNVSKYFAERGVTIEYVGLANSLNYDDEVQKAINHVYIAKEETAAFKAQESAMEVRKTIANIHVIENFAQGLLKWNGGLPALPSFIMWPQGLTDTLYNWMSPAKDLTKPVK